jgi:VanZ like family
LTFIYKKFIPAIVYFIIITVLFCLPSSALPDTGGNWFQDYHIDKLIHATIFGILVFIFCRPIQLKGFFNSIVTKIYFLIAIIFCFYGILIEFIQKWWIKGRSFDGYDILADAVGCFIGYAIAKRIVKKTKQPTTEELQTQLMDYAKKFVSK